MTRRDAIAEMLRKGIHPSAAVEVAERILTLPIEQAGDRVIEAARAFRRDPRNVFVLTDALAELDALEGNNND